MPYTVPDPSEPMATPLSVYGNNATVACPCGRVIVVRSIGAPGIGMWGCSCERRYKGYPEEGQAITHILVWERTNVGAGAAASYRVKIEAPRQA
jgi:hypothetical protein